MTTLAALNGIALITDGNRPAWQAHLDRHGLPRLSAACADTGRQPALLFEVEAILHRQASATDAYRAVDPLPQRSPKPARPRAAPRRTVRHRRPAGISYAQLHRLLRTILRSRRC